MNKHNEFDDNEEVVVIERRDKQSYLYIAIAAVLGIALGGLIGSTVTTSRWETSYQALQTSLNNSIMRKQKFLKRLSFLSKIKRKRGNIKWIRL